MSTRLLVICFAVSWLTLAACSREKGDWRSAQAADSVESYQAFIEKHPDSSHVAAARERLTQLHEEKDWRAAAEADTPQAYEQFLAQHASGRWAKEAKERIANFANASGAPAASQSNAPTAAAAATAAPLSAGYGVQLGAFSSAERANQEWTRLQSVAKGTLDGLSPRVVVGDASGKTIYRLQAEVRDEVQARAICGGLKMVQKPCVPIIPH